jgi:hypothetical protein
MSVNKRQATVGILVVTAATVAALLLLRKAAAANPAIFEEDGREFGC